MSECIEAFQAQLVQSPEIVDRFFKNGKFDVAALLEGAEALGYEIEMEELDDELHSKPLAGALSFLLPNSETGGITEMTIEEVELVAAGIQTKEYPVPDYANININVNVVVVAAAVAVVIAAVLVFVFI
jgi:hypothetical protein